MPRPEGHAGNSFATALTRRFSESSNARRAAALQALEELRRQVGSPPLPATCSVQDASDAVSPGTAPGSPEPRDNGPGDTMTETFADGTAGAAFTRIYRDAEWGSEARSGLGSFAETTKEFRDFLEAFLRERGVSSVVDAGCGHWPSGYQRFMNWQGVHYTGVDVVPYVVRENRDYFREPGVLASHGLASAEFLQGDVSSLLPPAELLIVKDVLMHLPNSDVQAFLRNNVDDGRPRYQAVLLVQNSVPVNLRQNIDIEPGQLLPFDICSPPFNARFDTVLRWKSDEPKTIQVWEP